MTEPIRSVSVSDSPHRYASSVTLPGDEFPTEATSGVAAWIKSADDELCLWSPTYAAAVFVRELDRGRTWQDGDRIEWGEFVVVYSDDDWGHGVACDECPAAWSGDMADLFTDEVDRLLGFGAP